MAKKFFRRWIPTPHRAKRGKLLGRLGHLLHEPGLWHLNRHSAARGVAVGVFWSFIPIPGQTLFAALTAIEVRAHIWLAVVMPWIAPVILFPAFYLSYRIGLIILRQEPMQNFFEHFPSWTWFWTHRGAVLPFLVGSVPVASLLGLTGYFIVQGLWRWSLVRRWRNRNERRRRAMAENIAGSA